MDDYPIGLHLPRSVFLALVEHTGEAFYSDRAQSILCEVINQWISSGRRTPGGLNNHQDGVQAELKGYQWKQVFLPNGTELRTAFHGRSVYARVENEHIICDGAVTTPSRLANAYGCGTRNAWNAIWLRLPGSGYWALAASYRRAKKSQPEGWLARDAARAV